ncbi:V-type proton ATPase subunit c'' [Morella rubra]|uniref:V-type proton ATPase subunit c n=1 Tax=Morella rubra TaxID=262757 RepID=A0A6A1UVX1_9ROSI|nr:V-type proton ATPase subunit c'' [Morella rubra]
MAVDTATWAHALARVSPYTFSAIGIAVAIGVSVLGAAWGIFITGSSLIGAAIKAPRITSKNLIRTAFPCRAFITSPGQRWFLISNLTYILLSFVKLLLFMALSWQLFCKTKLESVPSSQLYAPESLRAGYAIFASGLVGFANLAGKEFEEGGLAIGLSCFHLLADPTCAALFIKAWADTALGRKMLSPPFFHPLPPRRPGNKIPSHEPYTALIDHYNYPSENSAPFTDAKHTTITLAFSDHTVQACMRMAQLPPGPNNPDLSPFEALAGLFWVCVSKVKGLGNGLVNMSICLDSRKVLGLDKGFFGNCTVYNKVHSAGTDEHRLPEARAIGKKWWQKWTVRG